MARKRLVSPELFTHPVLGKLDDALSMVFIGLWTQSDRRGIFRWRPDVLRLAIRPYKDDDFEELMEGLVSTGFITRYEVGGEQYGQVPKFHKWQTFHVRERPSSDPEPPQHRASTVPAPVKHGASTPGTVTVTVTGTVGAADPAPVQHHAGPVLAGPASALDARRSCPSCHSQHTREEAGKWIGLHKDGCQIDPQRRTAAV